MASVIMFHSVGLRSHRWMGRPIAEDIGPFVAKIEALRRAGYRSVKLTDPALRDGRPRDRLVCLTFDDGYLDNWVHVFPVLEAHGMEATILVTPEFVDPRDLKRPLSRPGTVHDDEHDASACCAGFLSWPEMRAMVETGRVEIQSHALTHTWYARGPRIVDYWHPGAATEVGGPVWMLWNQFPELKPFYLTEAVGHEPRIPYGTPVYENGKALVTRRYVPDEHDLQERLREHVAREGDAGFFAREEWRQELDAIVREHRAHAGGEPAGTFETEAEYHARVRHELTQSRRILQENLGTEVEALAWPGGGTSPMVLEIAREAGYRVFTAPRSLDAAHLDTDQGALIQRVGSAGRVSWRSRDLGNVTGPEFLWYLRSQEGSTAARWVCRGVKLVRVVRSFVR